MEGIGTITLACFLCDIDIFPLNGAVFFISLKFDLGSYIQSMYILVMEYANLQN